MKKHLTVIMFAIILMVSVSSQSIAQVKLGVIGGFNFNDITGTDNGSEGMSIGYHVGGFVNIGQKLMIEPQLLYCRKGSQINEGNLNLDYIEIPIWVRYQLENGFNFNAGPFISALMGAKADGTDVKDAYEGSDWGLGVGIGYQLEGGLGLALTFSQGISNIAEDYEIGGQSFEFDAKTTCIKVSASYMFGGRRD